jgi:hypothetical protein
MLCWRRSRRESRSEEEWEEKTKENLEKYRRMSSPSPFPVRYPAPPPVRSPPSPSQVPIPPGPPPVRYPSPLPQSGTYSPWPSPSQVPIPPPPVRYSPPPLGQYIYRCPQCSESVMDTDLDPRIRPLAYESGSGSGSCSYLSVPFKIPTKN